VHTRRQLVERHGGPATGVRALLAHHQLAELATTYDDLIADLQGGRRRLPRYQTRTGPGPI